MSTDRGGDWEGPSPAMLEAAERWVAETAVRPPRWQRALRVLLDGESLTVIDATRKYGEWKFRQTIREIQARGVKLRARPEIAFDSITCRTRLVWRYQLRPESRKLAAKLLASAVQATAAAQTLGVKACCDRSLEP